MTQPDAPHPDAPQPDVSGMYDGDVVVQLATGQPPFERGSEAEPSLLPHLARLCHDFSIGELLYAADLFGNEHPYYSWPQIHESVRNRLVVRFDHEQFELQAPHTVDPVEHAIRRCIIGADTPSAELWERVDALGGSQLGVNLTCRLLALDATPDARRYERIVDEMDVRWTEAAAVSALIDVGHRLERLDHEHVLGDIIDVDTMQPGWIAHLLPSLPAAQRTALADELVRSVIQRGAPAWLLALYASRLATYTSSRATWDGDGIVLSEYPDHVWRRWIEQLLDAPPAPDRESDTLRAHPFAATLDRIEGPHETTSGLATQITYAYGGAPPVESAPPPDEPIAVSPSPPSAAPAPVGAPAPGGEPAPVVDDRRLGVDFFADGRHLTRAVVVDVPTDVEVSIGHGATVSLTTPINVHFDEGVDIRSLPVRFVVDDVVDESATLRLRRDPSSTASVTFTVIPTAPILDAVVIVYNEDRSAVIQAAALSVAVVGSFADAEEATPSITLSTIPAAAFSIASRPDSATVVTDGRTTVATARHLSLPASSHSTVAQVQEILKSIETDAGNHLAAGTSIDATLIRLARAGVRLRHDACLDELEPFERIQVVSVTGQTVFPVELVYSGPAPRDDATLCPKWKRSARKGSCRSCTPADSTSVVCPARFWGISKVIEHHCGETVGGTEYSARVQITDDLVALGALGPTVLAASALLAEHSIDRASLELLTDAAKKFGRVDTAPDWATWAALVSEHGPTVLVALPHQGATAQHHAHDFAGVAALEIGGVFETTFEEFHLRRSGDAPGPLVLLIGCNTGVERHVIASFAARFRRWSPVVVATLGEVLVEEADLVAATVLTEVAKAARKRSRTTMGEAVRNARRTLLADSKLAGLQLVLHGDAAWSVGKDRR
jgi:hypothetical protein